MIDAVQNVVTMFPIRPTVVRTTPHGNHVLGLGHLFVKAFHPSRHLQRDCSGNDHEVRLTRGGTGNEPESFPVKA
jgi:hypothetical protein